MAWTPASLWRRLRTWWARRLGLWRGRWRQAELEAPVARWTWWTWPWSLRRWSYAVYCPAGLTDADPAPLLVLLHGCRQEALAFAHASGWVREAERHRFRLLCPEQRRDANPYGCWNWFHPAAQTGRGEQDVVLQALAATQARYAVGATAVAGLSAGGALAALLAFHHADCFDAAVTVAAPPLLGRAPLQDPRRVMRQGLSTSPLLATLLLTRCAPLLVLQGDADEVVAPCCADQLADQARGVLARAHGELRDAREGEARTWRDGDGRLRLALHRLPRMGHAWTGAPGGHAHVSRDGPPLTAIALDFLRQQRVLG